MPAIFFSLEAGSILRPTSPRTKLLQRSSWFRSLLYGFTWGCLSSLSACWLVFMWINLYPPISGTLSTMSTCIFFLWLSSLLACTFTGHFICLNLPISHSIRKKLLMTMMFIRKSDLLVVIITTYLIILSANYFIWLYLCFIFFHFWKYAFLIYKISYNIV